MHAVRAIGRSSVLHEDREEQSDDGHDEQTEEDVGLNVAHADPQGWTFPLLKFFASEVVPSNHFTWTKCASE